MPDIPHLDKVIHFAVYAGMAVLFLFAAPRAAMGTIKAGIAAVCGCIAYGLLLELIQGLLTESRQMSSGDFIANSLGALGGTVLFMRIYAAGRPDPGERETNG
jgi:VanZ family protein